MTRSPIPSTGSTPPESGGDAHADLVAGDPPVPITVWRTPVADADGSVPQRLAERLVAAYSRPGEIVVDVTGDHALTHAASAGGRRHHPAWFTDAAALIVGAPTPPATATNAARPPRRRRRRGDADAPPLAAWFGDDLTDPDLPPTGAAHPTTDDGDGTVRSVTSLTVAGWPLHDLDAEHRARLRALLEVGVVLLRPGGCLVLVVGAAARTAARPEDFGPLVAAARDAGLGYLQHIVAVRADATGDQFVYYATDDELLTLARDTTAGTVAHLRVHADLLVFSPLTGSGRGGGRG